MKMWKSLLVTSLVLGAVMAAGCAKKAEETTPASAPADTSSMAPADTAAIPADTTSMTTPAETPAVAEKPAEASKSTVAAKKPAKKGTPAVPVAQTKPKPIMVPAGTAISVALNDELTTKTAKEGDTFQGRLTEDVVVDGKVAFPKGATVEGHVVKSVRGGGKDSKHAHLQLAYDRIIVDGLATALGTTGADMEGKSGTSGDVKRIGGGAAAGAAAGAILGGGKGAAKGAIIGGVAGTAASMLAHAPDVKVEAGAPLSVTLDHTVMVGDKAVEAARK